MELALAVALIYAVYTANTAFKTYMKVRFGEKKPEEPMPATLYNHAMAYSEAWAREDSLKRLHELYELHGRDWSKVASMVLSTDG